MYYLLVGGLGVLPSIVWLTFYLKEDIHPEPRKWLVLVFLLGMAVTPMVVILEQSAIKFFMALNIALPNIATLPLRNLAIIFIAIAAIEEFFKYLPVWIAMKKNPVFDEPADAMIYMIVSALGFAAVENILTLHSFAPVFFADFTQPLATLAVRFIGATFLHTLSSGIVGFYFALSLVRRDHMIIRRKSLLLRGFILATLLHGTFNYFIIILRAPLAIYISIPLLVISIFVLKDFKILQKIRPNDFSNN